MQVIQTSYSLFDMNVRGFLGFDNPPHNHYIKNNIYQENLDIFTGCRVADAVSKMR